MIWYYKFDYHNNLMSSESRTKNSLRNSSVALAMFFVNLVLQFISRKIFLDYLGTEILGLNTTATNILQFLNLAELGVWTAIASSLYKPLSSGNKKEICRIITFNGHIYRRIAVIIIALSVIVMCFFPLIFSKMKLPLWYAYASFAVLLFSSLLAYFFNYKQFLLSADQKDYKVQLSYKLNISVKVAAQIIVMCLLPNPYIWWLVLEVVFAISGTILLQIVVRKTYPYLKDTGESFQALRKAYPEIILKVKQLFFQKISGFALFQIAPLIIYGFFSLTLVSYYYNYMIVIMGIISLVSALFNSMLAGIGNLVATSSHKHIYNVFFQLFSVRFLIITWFCFIVVVSGQTFIEAWIGKQYLLPDFSLYLFTIVLFLYLSRYIICDYLAAYGWFGDIWASIAEIVLNIGFSILLGHYYGLNGIIFGMIISLLIVSTIWKPIYLFHFKLKAERRRYIYNYALNIIVCGVSFLASYRLFNLFQFAQSNIWIRLIYSAITAAIIYLINSGILYYLLVPSFRSFLARFQRHS